MLIYIARNLSYIIRDFMVGYDFKCHYNSIQERFAKQGKKGEIFTWVVGLEPLDGKISAKTAIIA